MHWNAKPSSLRLRLLVTMIGSVVVISASAMALDYHREHRRGLERITASLEEQASALQAAYVLMTDPNQFRRYVDEFCATMEERISPGHHVLVLDSDGGVLAASRQHSGPDVERALLKATSRRGVTHVQGHRLAYIRSSDAETNTFILAQYLDRVEATLHDQLIRRAVSLILITLTIILFVYLAVALWVIGPLEKLINVTKQWASRNFSARAPLSGPSDIQVAAREFNAMADELEVHEQRLRQEFDEARQIQTDLLPRFPGDVGGLLLTAEYQPAAQVAGDLYDVFALPGGRIALAVLDVSGHGISAAMLTGVAKISLRRCLIEYSNLSRAMKHVNSDIFRCTSESYFVTACVGIWHPQDSRWTYCAAGHPGGVLIRHGQARELPSTAPLLGVLPNGQWDTTSLVLSPSDRVYLYTDGIVEAEVNDTPFGVGRLVDLLRRTSDLKLSEQARAVIETVNRQGSGLLHDDATVFAFEFKAVKEARVSITT